MSRIVELENVALDRDFCHSKEGKKKRMTSAQASLTDQASSLWRLPAEGQHREHVYAREMPLSANGSQSLQSLALHLGPVGLLCAAGSEEQAGRLVLLEDPLEPLYGGHPELAAVRVSVGTGMSHVEVADPLGHAGEGVVVSLALQGYLV